MCNTLYKDHVIQFSLKPYELCVVIPILQKKLRIEGREVLAEDPVTTLLVGKSNDVEPRSLPNVKALGPATAAREVQRAEWGQNGRAHLSPETPETVPVAYPH